jgi:hypothetical protein
MGVKWPGSEADHSPPSSAEVKNAWIYTSTPQYAFTAWCLVKHRDNFTFTFYFVIDSVRKLLDMPGVQPKRGPCLNLFLFLHNYQLPTTYLQQQQQQLMSIYIRCWKCCPLTVLHISTRFIMFPATRCSTKPSISWYTQ